VDRRLQNDGTESAKTRISGVKAASFSNALSRLCKATACQGTTRSTVAGHPSNGVPARRVGLWKCGRGLNAATIGTAIFTALHRSDRHGSVAL